ncbi:hypothetical protein K438DRAFT_1977333 [Mycena galopus ATCC 62051]|nr:hypothetical protein K438DRAFT_1977333 [Mycena galopus ATCC 62051]
MGHSSTLLATRQRENSSQVLPGAFLRALRTVLGHGSHPATRPVPFESALATGYVRGMIFLDPVPTYPGHLANAQPPPAYEQPPAYEDVVGHVEQRGDLLGMIESPLAQDNHIVSAQLGQPADAGAFGRLRKAYARVKKWVARGFRG